MRTWLMLLAVALVGCGMDGGSENVDGLYRREEQSSSGVQVFCKISNQSTWETYGVTPEGARGYRRQGKISAHGDSLHFTATRTFVGIFDSNLVPCTEDCFVGVFYVHGDSLVQFQNEALKEMRVPGIWLRVE